MPRKSLVIAALLTFVVFTAGMAVQWQLDKQRIQEVSQSMSDLRLGMNSLLAQQQLEDQLSVNNCAATRQQVQQRVETLSDYGEKLSSFEDKELFGDQTYQRLKHEYHLLQISHWLDIRALDRNCPNTTLTPVLYFYTQNCGVCDQQGVVLTGIRKEHPHRVQTFALDYNMRRQEPAVRMLTNHFNITRTPSLVIDGETLTGFHTREELIAALPQSTAE